MGCDASAWQARAPRPPSVLSPLVPGGEVPGARVVAAADGSGIGSLRVSAGAVRVYAADGTRLGRLRVAESGWVLEGRDGTDLCDVRVEGSGGAITCSSSPSVSVVLDPTLLRVRLGGAERTFVRGEAEGAASLPSEGSGAWQLDAGRHRVTLDDPGGALSSESVAAWGVVVGAEGSGDAPLLRAAAAAFVASRLVRAERRTAPGPDPAVPAAAPAGLLPPTAADQNVPPSEPTGSATGSGAESPPASSP
jgi:hypothetical protein